LKYKPEDFRADRLLNYKFWSQNRSKDILCVKFIRTLTDALQFHKTKNKLKCTVCCS